jgi:hypothetical protein
MFKDDEYAYFCEKDNRRGEKKYGMKNKYGKCKDYKYKGVK